MSLSQRLAELVRAAYSAIWIESHEHEDAISEIAQLCKDQQWELVTWDVDRGLQSAQQKDASATDPVAAIHSIGALAQPEQSVLLLLPNFHRFLNSTEIIQALAHQIGAGKRDRTFIVVLSPVVQIPAELQTQFIVIEHDLPDRDQLLSIASGIATEAGELPTGDEQQRLLDAAAGLTRFEAEGAFSLSLVREGKLTPRTIWELKSSMLKKNGLLSMHRGGETFADLGGLDGVKRFCKQALSSPTRSSQSKRAKPRGILLLGVPGTGKSALAKALGNEMQRPTLTMDIGALLGSLVGQSESNIRQALKLADAMSPCVLFVDELEKAFAGSSGANDSGVSARLFGSLLTWLSDHSSDVFFIGTCNDISRLPPEFSRAERFDAIFFIDTPASSEKASIWPLYLKMYDIPAESKRPEDRDWTAAEIRACCRLASLLDLSLIDAAKHVVPVAVTAAEQVTQLRAWASGRCLDASRGGIYTQGAAEVKPTRRVSRSSTN